MGTFVKSILVVLCAFLAYEGLFLLSTTPHAEEKSKVSITIGVQLPLSGALNFVGTDIQRGITMALEDISSTPIEINVIYEDDRAAAVGAASAAQLLVAHKKVDVIVSLWDMAEIVAPVAERAGIPHISIRWNPHVAERYSHTFTLESTYKTFARFQLNLARKSGAKTLGMITEESTGWILVREYIEATASEYDLHVVSSDTYTPSASLDLRPIITRVLSRKPDFIILNNFQPWVVPTIRLLKQLGPSQKFTGYFEGIEDPSVVEGIPFVNQSNTAPGFKKRFIEKFGEAYRMRAPHAYDIIRIVHNAYMQSPSKKLSSDAVVTYLKQIHQYDGQCGVLTTNATKNIETEPILQVFRNGQADSL